MKKNRGRVDEILQLVQEVEHCMSMEREMLLSLVNSKPVLHNRSNARKQPRAERDKLLALLCAQVRKQRDVNGNDNLTIVLPRFRVELDPSRSIIFILC